MRGNKERQTRIIFPYYSIFSAFNNVIEALHLILEKYVENSFPYKKKTSRRQGLSYTGQPASSYPVPLNSKSTLKFSIEEFFFSNT